MKNILSPILLLLLLSSCSPKISEKLTWQGTKVTADGRISEWPNPLRFYDEKTRINYTITNDRKNLYICMKVFDEGTKAKIIHGGMEFRIDTLGKKTFPVALIFPMPNQIVMVKHSPNEMPQGKHPGEHTDHVSGLQKMLNQAEEAKLVGFKPALGEILQLLNNTSGISAAISLDSLGILYYEAIIPFKTFWRNELTSADVDRAFNYEIKVNALPAPPPHTGNGEAGGVRGMSGGGNMGGEGGGMGGGSHGGGGMGGGGHRGGMGGGGSHGGQHSGGGGGSPSGNSDLYSAVHVMKIMRFSMK